MSPSMPIVANTPLLRTFPKKRKSRAVMFEPVLRSMSRDRRGRSVIQADRNPLGCGDREPNRLFIFPQRRDVLFHQALTSATRRESFFRV